MYFNGSPSGRTNQKRGGRDSAFRLASPIILRSHITDDLARIGVSNSSDRMAQTEPFLGKLLSLLVSAKRDVTSLSSSWTKSAASPE